MASTSIVPALIERIKEVTRKKHPGVDIMRKIPSKIHDELLYGEKIKRPRKRKKFDA